MFEDATFHSRGILPTQTRKWMLFALAFNLTILAALITLPLIYPEGLPNQILHHVLDISVPTSTAPAPSHPAAQTVSRFNPLIPPLDLTKLTKIDRMPLEPAQPSAPYTTLNLGDSVPGGGDRQADNVFHSNPPPEVRQAQPSRVAISQGVAGGLLISKVNPVYSPIAIATHTSGTVSLAATISKSGTIENLHVISGPPLLRQAAVEAVSRWRYRPYLLNGQPVEVDTTINVVFRLGE